MKRSGIGFNVLNLGSIVTEEALRDMENGDFKGQHPIPISDIASTLDWLMSLASNVDVGDVNLSQKMANKAPRLAVNCSPRMRHSV